jgi:Protein of unknown function (DUF1176)
MLLPSALGVWAMLSGLTPAQAKTVHPDYRLMRDEVQQYGNWLVGCDNNADCTMIGFPETLALRVSDVAAHDMAIQISLKGPAETVPVVELVPFPLDAGRKAADDKAEPFVLNVEYDVAAISPKHGFSRQELLPMEAVAVVRHLGDDKRLEGKALSNNKVIVRFPQAEFKRAFLAMQNRHAQLQKQMSDEAIANLPGELPDGSTMPIPAKHRRIPATPHIVSGFVPILPHSLCRHSFMLDMHYYRFANGALLWSYACEEGSNTSRTYWEMAPQLDTVATPLDLPEPRDRRVQAGVDGLENAIFDWDFGILRAYNYEKGREDCGTFRAWGFTDSGWQLLEQREMPLCKGLSPDQWIRTHYIPTDGAGTDE